MDRELFDKNHQRMINWWSDTYVFYSWDESKQRYIECFHHTNATMQDTYDCYQKDKDFKKLNYFYDLQLVELFQGIPNTVEMGESIGKQKNLYLELFTDVFDLTGQNSWNFKYHRIILPKKEQEFIDKVIQKHNLLEIRDLIFEIIAVAKDFYFYDVNPPLLKGNNSRKILKQKYDAEKRRMERDLAVITKSFDTYTEWRKNRFKNPRPEFTISFKIKGVSNEIKDQFIIYNLIERLKKSFEADGDDKDWRRALTFLNVAETFRKNADFNENFAFALYDLLVKGGFIKINKDPTPNPIMDFIVDIFDCCQIPIGKFSIRAIGNKGKTDKARLKTIRCFFDKRPKPL
jgi:hypothetical protein